LAPVRSSVTNSKVKKMKITDRNQQDIERQQSEINRLRRQSEY